jgi:hypothetical protein
MVRKTPSLAAICAAQADLVHEIQDLDCAIAPGFVPERAHVVGVANGGSDEPGNFFLLCSRCHRGQPDGAPPKVQCAWLLGHEGEFSITLKIWRSSIRAMVAAAEAAGDPELLDVWVGELGVEGLGALYARGMASACSSHQETVFSTARAGVVEAFKTWVELRSAGGTR